MPEPPRPLEPARQVGAPARPPVRTASHFKPPPLTHRLQVRPVSVVQHHLPADANQKPNSQAHRQSLHTQHLPAFFTLAAKKADGCQLQSVPFLPVRRQQLHLRSTALRLPEKQRSTLTLSADTFPSPTYNAPASTAFSFTTASCASLHFGLQLIQNMKFKGKEIIQLKRLLHFRSRL